jgi:V/A-type H+-transporting ATPase subunit I
MGIAIGVFIAIILHALNILISAFSPTIHAFRLNFIEFFGKFVEDGGVEYEPFHRTSGAREVSGEE